MEWDKVKPFETGVDHGVLYPFSKEKGYANGVAFNGLQSVNENPSGAEPTAFYADNIKYANILSNEEYAATIETYYYPDEFAECLGKKELVKGVKIGQQTHKSFGFAYRTLVGDETNPELGYILHLIYGCLAAPSEENHETTNENVDIKSMSFEISTTPVAVPGCKPTATIELSSLDLSADQMNKIESVLYGVVAPDFAQANTYKAGDVVTYQTKVYKATKSVSAGAWNASDWEEFDNSPRLPLPEEIATILAEG